MKINVLLAIELAAITALIALLYAAGVYTNHRHAPQQVAATTRS